MDFLFDKRLKCLIPSPVVTTHRIKREYQSQDSTRGSTFNTLFTTLNRPSVFTRSLNRSSSFKVFQTLLIQVSLSNILPIPQCLSSRSLCGSHLRLTQPKYKRQRGYNPSGGGLIFKVYSL